MTNNHEMTELSEKEFLTIKNHRFSSRKAYDYINSKLPLRNFGETLIRCSGEIGKGEDGKARVKKILTDRFCEYNPDMSRDNIAKKISGWLSGKYKPSDRESYLQICFALEMDEDTANNFLSISDETGFHYRNPRELAYVFALRTKMDYQSALKFYEALEPLPDDKSEKENGELKFTETVYNDFYRVSTAEEFYEFYNSNKKYLGTLHNTAYHYMMEFIKKLKEPDEELFDLFGKDDKEGKSQRWSIETVTEKYLRMNVPYGTGNIKASNVSKAIKQYWPSVTTMKLMCSKAEDVKRKVLILLFLVTEGLIDDANWPDIADENALTDEEMFEENFNRISIMLIDCGMAPPDPRNVFDWVALFALKMNNTAAMSEEMEKLLEKIFSEESQADL